MSEHIEYCYEDEDISRVAQGMADVRVRRLAVVNREKRLVGILSLGDLARMEAQRNVVAEAVAEVSTPGGPHRQAPER
jgi:predicted transcriptional regulator